MDNIYINKTMRWLSFFLLFIAIAPMITSCADDQFEEDNDEEYQRHGEKDSFPMRLITPEALQGVWNCDNNQITFDNDNFKSTGAALGNISGKFIITGNAIRVYEGKERIGYFPIIYFKRNMVIRYNSTNYRFIHEGDAPEGDPNDNPNVNPNDDPEVFPIDNSSFVGVWAVGKAEKDGESVYLDVNWINSRLSLNENGSFYASYWLGEVDESSPYSSYYPNFIPLKGNYTIDKNWNITLKPTNVNGTIYYQYIASETKDIPYQGDIYGNKNYKKIIKWIEYKFKKDNHIYMVRFYKI